MTLTPELAASILFLTEEEDPTYRRGALETILSVCRTYPARFIGELSALNPVVDWITSKPERLDNLKVMVDARRSESHMELMFPAPEEPKFDLRAYQKEAMRERRRRAFMVRVMENATRPVHDRVRGVNRIEYERKTLLKWGEELQRRLDNATLRALGKKGRLKKAVARQIRDKFWAEVDKRLEDQADMLIREGKLTRADLTPRV